MVRDISHKVAEGLGRPLKRQYLAEWWDSHVGQKTLSLPNFWIESFHPHCKGGEDKETERKEWTAWCG